MKTARFLSIFGALVLVLIVVQAANASVLTGAKLTLSDSRPSLSSTHTFSFTTTSSNTLQTVEVLYCQEPSYDGTCTRPGGFGLANVSGGDLSGLVGLDSSWTLANNDDDTNLLTLSRPTSGQDLGADAVVGFAVAGVTNATIAGCNESSNDSTSTCYAHITTYEGIGSLTTEVDSVVVSYTVVAAVTVTARVDPTFTFLVEGVNASTLNNGVTTSVNSAYNTLPFGNLTAGTPKYAAHKLTVTTNTQSGYTVAIKMVVPMTGVYSANNIDPFYTEDPHAAWAEPTGTTPSDNTGWIGYNTSDNDVTNWDGTGDSNQFAGVSSSSEATVMKKTSSDNGSTSDYVSYAVEVNVNQPSDTYTGTLEYIALPTY